jgi:hypothetical protein
MSINDPHEVSTLPLRLAPPLVDANDDRNLVLEVLRRAAASGKHLIVRGLQLLSRFPVLVRASNWLTRIRSWWSPASIVVVRSGVALPVWLATTPVVQRVVVEVTRRAGTIVRVGLLAGARLVQRALSIAGLWGERQAAKLGRAVERIDGAAAAFGSKVSAWATGLSASRGHVRFVHDVSLVVVVARQLRAVVPAPWRLAATGLSLLTLGGQTRRWIVRAFHTATALVREIIGAFTAPQPVTAMASNGPTVPIRPVAPQRTHHPRPHHNR